MDEVHNKKMDDALSNIEKGLVNVQDYVRNKSLNDKNFYKSQEYKNMLNSVNDIIKALSGSKKNEDKQL